MRRTVYACLFLLLAAACAAPLFGVARRASAPNFYYAGGTLAFSTDCAGKLGVSHASMTFACPEGSITIPYRSITLMEYRPSLSRKVKRMKLRWKVRPTESARNKNLLFTVLFKEGDETQAMVLRVLPEQMRPYLAEIELSAGKRIEVWDYRGFD